MPTHTDSLQSIPVYPTATFPILSPRIFPRPDPFSYYGLLTHPPGRYSLLPRGDAMAVTLRGQLDFLMAATNMFSSLGTDVLCSDRRGGQRREYRELWVRKGEQEGTLFFCMPTARVHLALRTYLYTRICAAKAERVRVVDDEGDFVRVDYLNEDAMLREADDLAVAFMAYEMVPADYAVLGTYISNETPPPEEHRVFEPEWGGVEENGGTET